MNFSARATRVSALACGIAAALAAGAAAASGFQLRENSVKASGRASAGAASAYGDAAVVANNPALMTRFKLKTAQVDGSAIDLSFKFKGNTCMSGSDYDASTRTCDRYVGQNDNKGGNAGGLNAVPAFSLVLPLHDGLEGFALGASVGAPFGLKTDYDKNWSGRYLATLSDVKVVDLNLAAAADLGDHFSIGVGVIAEYMKVTLANRIDFASGICAQVGNLLCALLPSPIDSAYAHRADGTYDGSVSITGDDVAFGWDVGLNWRPVERLSFGLNYRPEIKHKLKGDGDFTVPADLQGLLDLGAPGVYVDGGGGADFTVPKIATASMTWQATRKLALMAEYQMTGWSSFKQIAIKFDPNEQNPDGMTQTEHYDWKDSRYVAVGAEYKLADNFTLRGGIGFDSSPIRDDYRTRTLDYGDGAEVTDTYRTPRLPDEDRRLYALGMSWMPGENWEFSADWEHVQIAKAPKVDLVGGESAQGARLVGEFSGSADVFGLAAQFHF